MVEGVLTCFSCYEGLARRFLLSVVSHRYLLVGLLRDVRLERERIEGEVRCAFAWLVLFVYWLVRRLWDVSYSCLILWM